MAMQPVKNTFKTRREHGWTAERLASMSTSDLQQLRANAETLAESELVALCDTALADRPRSGGKGGGSVAPRQARRLISRRRAFEARGVYLPAFDSSWSGVRKSDGVVVMSLWAGAVITGEEGCSQLLWGPNVDGANPWADKLGGRERAAHCKLALERGSAEGLLVQGSQKEGPATEDNARSVYGVDPEVVIHFRVEQRGNEYWAVWGGKAEAKPL